MYTKSSHIGHIIKRSKVKSLQKILYFIIVNRTYIVDKYLLILSDLSGYC